MPLNRNYQFIGSSSGKMKEEERVYRPWIAVNRTVDLGDLGPAVFQH